MKYNKIDHRHCWSQEEPPCGLPGRHRCCLCEEAVPEEKEAEKFERGWAIIALSLTALAFVVVVAIVASIVVSIF